MLRGIFAALALAALTTACEKSLFSMPVHDAGLDAKADALGPVPVIFSEGEPALDDVDDIAAAHVYSLNR